MPPCAAHKTYRGHGHCLGHRRLTLAAIFLGRWCARYGGGGSDVDELGLGDYRYLVDLFTRVPGIDVERHGLGVIVVRGVIICDGLCGVVGFATGIIIIGGEWSRGGYDTHSCLNCTLSLLRLDQSTTCGPSFSDELQIPITTVEGKVCLSAVCVFALVVGSFANPSQSSE